MVVVVDDDGNVDALAIGVAVSEDDMLAGSEGVAEMAVVVDE